MIPEVDNLFRNMTPAAYAVAQYCSACIAHRLLKCGWEKEVNFLDQRRLILLAMFLPPHTRIPIIDEAYRKAQEAGDQEVVALLAAQAAAYNQQMKASA